MTIMTMSPATSMVMATSGGLSLSLFLSATGMRRQRGLTVAELLVALALGLLVTLAGSALLLSASAGYTRQAEAARLSDSGRFALEIVARAVRQAAYVNRDGNAAPAEGAPEDAASVGGWDARSVAKTSDGIAAPLASAVNGSDVLALRFAGSGGGAGGDGTVLNCAGFGVPAASVGDARGWSIFYVAADADGEAELRCKYRSDKSWGADAIVRGVDAFQVLYGLDMAQPPQGVAQRYVSASAIQALDAALALGGADVAARERDRNRKTHWKRVVSVKIALLLHGEAALADPPSAPVDLFGTAYADSQGGADPGVRFDPAAQPRAQRQRLRQLFQSTILLRNRAG